MLHRRLLWSACTGCKICHVLALIIPLFLEASASLVPGNVIQQHYASIRSTSSRLTESNVFQSSELLTALVLDTSSSLLRATNAEQFWDTARSCLLLAGVQAKEVELPETVKATESVEGQKTFESGTASSETVHKKAIEQFYANRATSIQFVSLDLSVFMDTSVSPRRLYYQGVCPGRSELTLRLGMDCAVTWDISAPESAASTITQKETAALLSPVCKVLEESKLSQKDSTIVLLVKPDKRREYSSEWTDALTAFHDSARHEPTVVGSKASDRHITMRIISGADFSSETMKVRVGFRDILGGSGLSKQRELQYPYVEETLPIDRLQIGSLSDTSPFKFLQFFMAYLILVPFSKPPVENLSMIGLGLAQAFTAARSVVHDATAPMEDKVQASDALKQLRIYRERVVGSHFQKASTSARPIQIEVVAPDRQTGAKRKTYSYFCGPAILEVPEHSTNLVQSPELLHRIGICSLFASWSSVDDNQPIMEIVSKAIFVPADNDNHASLQCYVEKADLAREQILAYETGPGGEAITKTPRMYIKELIAFTNPTTMTTLRDEMGSSLYGPKSDTLRASILDLIARNTITGNEDPHRIFGVPTVEQRRRSESG